ncbi:MAG: SpoIVB peptidase [Oscillospiraceae bacterium]|nr:SpoIVB peptidase [Oscillospiraceae bacterium]
MFYRFYRKLTAVSIIFLSLLMTVVFIFQCCLPDNFYISENKLVFSSSFGKFITFDENCSPTKEVLSRQNPSFTVKAKLMGILPIKEVSVKVSDEKIVTVCGTPFGVKMFTDGVLVVNFSQIETENGNCCPAAESGLSKGDLIKSIDGTAVFRNEDVAKIIENSAGKSLTVSVLREGIQTDISVIPKMLKDKSGYKAGFWVRDSSAGIGTLTFYNPETFSFAGLGHAVCDVDTGTVLPFSSGEIVTAAITKIKKGISGAPGELSGTFTGTDKLGTVKINNETGLYGTLDYDIKGIDMPIAHKQNIYEGSAVILSTVEGTETEEYDILIEKIALSDDSLTKNMVIKVIDEELIEATGGIVQGMSGSPIIQDGKLVGAVTHVFVNDPTKGYGIFAENMLEMSEKCQ